MMVPAHLHSLMVDQLEIKDRPCLRCTLRLRLEREVHMNLLLPLTIAEQQIELRCLLLLSVTVEKSPFHN